MNLIEIAEDLKDLPDQYLMQEIQQPTGNFPSYLIVSELGRRKRMRDKVAKEMPSQTVAQELATPPQMPQQMPQGMAPQGLMAMPQAQTELAAQDAMGTTPPEMMMPAQQMAGGGIVSFRDGGDVQRFQNQGLVEATSPFQRFTGYDSRTAAERRREENRLRNAIRQKYGMASDLRGFFMDQTDEERAKAQEVMDRLKTLQTESPNSLEELRALLGQTESPAASPSAAPADAPAAAPAGAPPAPEGEPAAGPTFRIKYPRYCLEKLLPHQRRGIHPLGFLRLPVLKREMPLGKERLPSLNKRFLTVQPPSIKKILPDGKKTLRAVVSPISIRL
jgi:hypothetical protein